MVSWKVPRGTKRKSERDHMAGTRWHKAWRVRLESYKVYGVQKWEKLTQKREGNDSVLEEAMMD
jgi:hypothetical protein